MNDVEDVIVASTNASLFAYVADGRNGMKVLQLTSPTASPTSTASRRAPVPELIAWARTPSPAIALSKGLDRDRGGRRDRRPDRGVRPGRLAAVQPPGDGAPVPQQPRPPLQGQRHRLDAGLAAAAPGKGAGRAVTRLAASAQPILAWGAACVLLPPPPRPAAPERRPPPRVEGAIPRGRSQGTTLRTIHRWRRKVDRGAPRVLRSPTAGLRNRARSETAASLHAGTRGRERPHESSTAPARARRFSDPGVTEPAQAGARGRGMRRARRRTPGPFFSASIRTRGWSLGVAGEDLMVLGGVEMGDQLAVLPQVEGVAGRLGDDHRPVVGPLRGRSA